MDLQKSTTHLKARICTFVHHLQLLPTLLYMTAHYNTLGMLPSTDKTSI